MVIKRGTIVIWTNEFERIHIIHIFNETGGYKSFARSGKLELGDSFNFRFDESGEYKVRDLIFNWRQTIDVVD